MERGKENHRQRGKAACGGSNVRAWADRSGSTMRQWRHLIARYRERGLHDLTFHSFPSLSLFHFPDKNCVTEHMNIGSSVRVFYLYQRNENGVGRAKNKAIKSVTKCNGEETERKRPRYSGVGEAKLGASRKDEELCVENQILVSVWLIPVVLATSKASKWAKF